MSYNSSAARKLEVPKKTVKKVIRRKKVKAKTKVKKKTNNFANILYIACLFSMFMIIAFRYNSITEKNIQSMNLKEEIEGINSNLALMQTDIMHDTDLEYIEEYAKQKLGMQKPVKSQIIYIDTSMKKSIVQTEQTNFFSNITNVIKEYIKN